MDGRVYTIEDELDVIHEDLGRARAALDRLLRSRHDGRFTGDAVEYDDRVSAAQRRIGFLERELHEQHAALVAAEETHEL